MGRRTPNPQPDLSLVALVDWARLAAYIDGEGCIGIAAQVHRPPHEGRGRYDYVKITIANTDPRLSTWLLHNFGGHVQVRQRDLRWRRWKPCTYWILGSARATEVLRYCLPYFIIKREQAEVAMAFQTTMRRSGRRGTPQDVLALRERLKTTLHQLNARGPRIDHADSEQSGSVTH